MPMKKAKVLLHTTLGLSAVGLGFLLAHKGFPSKDNNEHESRVPDLNQKTPGPVAVKTPAEFVGFSAEVMEQIRQGEFAEAWLAVKAIEKVHKREIALKVAHRAFKVTAPQSVERWLTKGTPAVIGEFTTICALCYDSGKQKIHEALLANKVSRADPRMLSILLDCARLADRAWYSQNIKMLRRLYPEFEFLWENQMSQAPTETDFREVPELLETERFKNQDEPSSLLLKSFLLADETMLTANLDSIRALIKDTCTKGSYGHDVHGGYLEMINLARELLRTTGEGETNIYEVSPLKLGILLASRVEKSDNKNLHEILDFFPANVASAVGVFNVLDKFPGVLDDNFYANTGFKRFVGNGLNKSNEKNTLSSDLQLLDNALNTPSLWQHALGDLRHSYLAAANINWNVETVKSIPDEWRIGATAELLKTRAAESADAFMDAALQLNSTVGASTILKAAVDSGLDPFEVRGPAFARLFSENSISSEDLKPFVSRGGASFALENPTLLKDSIQEIPLLFTAWADANPYACSLYIEKATPSQQRNLAIEGMVKSLMKYDPESGRVWENLLKEHN
jgi:hypothetical protein